MNIEELEKAQAKQWRSHNQKLFGLSSIAYESTDKQIEQQLQKDEKRFWREGTNDFKSELLNSEKKIAQRNLIFDDTFSLAYNSKSNAIVVSVQYLESATIDGKSLNKAELEELARVLSDLRKGESPKSNKFSNAEIILSEGTIAYLPLVTRLGYRMRKVDYTLRTQAVPLNKPEYDKHDFRSFKYKYFSAVRSLVLNSKKSANFEKGRVINIASRLKSQSRYIQSNVASLSSNLILTQTAIEALEVSRQVVYSAKDARGFSFTGLSSAGGGGSMVII